MRQHMVLKSAFGLNLQVMYVFLWIRVNVNCFDASRSVHVHRNKIPKLNVTVSHSSYL